MYFTKLSFNNIYITNSLTLTINDRSSAVQIKVLWFTGFYQNIGKTFAFLLLPLPATGVPVAILYSRSAIAITQKLVGKFFTFY